MKKLGRYEVVERESGITVQLERLRAQRRECDTDDCRYPLYMDDAVVSVRCAGRREYLCLDCGEAYEWVKDAAR